MIKFFNLQEQYLDCKTEIDRTVQDVFAMGQFYANHYVDDLQADISRRYGGANTQLCNNGTSALHAALIALNIRAGTRILMPTLTYCATAQAAIAAGFSPEFVDIDQHWLMCPKHLNKLYERFRPTVGAVIAVDLYGQGMDLDWLVDWCHERKLPLIIDAAQSFGLSSSTYDQSRADAVTLSFNPLKNLGGSGHGGAVLSKTVDPERLRAACHEGKIAYGPRGQVNYLGLNHRIDAVQAAVILSKVPYWEKMMPRKKEIAQTYYAAFDSMRNSLDMHVRTDWCDCEYYVFTIAPKDPAKVKAALTAAGIEHSSHYDTPLHMEKAFSRYSQPLKNAEHLAGRVISLPCHWHLSDEQVQTVIETVQSSI